MRATARAGLASLINTICSIQPKLNLLCNQHTSITFGALATGMHNYLCIRTPPNTLCLDNFGFYFVAGRFYNSTQKSVLSHSISAHKHWRTLQCAFFHTYCPCYNVSSRKSNICFTTTLVNLDSTTGSTLRKTSASCAIILRTTLCNR